MKKRSIPVLFLLLSIGLSSCYHYEFDDNFKPLVTTKWWKDKQKFKDAIANVSERNDTSIGFSEISCPNGFHPPLYYFLGWIEKEDENDQDDFTKTIYSEFYIGYFFCTTIKDRVDFRIKIDFYPFPRNIEFEIKETSLMNFEKTPFSKIYEYYFKEYKIFTISIEDEIEPYDLSFANISELHSEVIFGFSLI